MDSQNIDHEDTETRSHQLPEIFRLRKPAALGAILNRLGIPTMSAEDVIGREQAVLHELEKQKIFHVMFALCALGLVVPVLYLVSQQSGLQALLLGIAIAALSFGAAFLLLFRLDPFLLMPWGKKGMYPFPYENLDRRVWFLGKLHRIPLEDGVEEAVEMVSDLCPEARIECTHIVSKMVPKRFWPSRITILWFICEDAKFAIDPFELYERDGD